MKTKAGGLFPFVPSGERYEEAIEFFAELGFAKAWGDENMAGLRFGNAYFILQNINIPVWQENQMLTYEVDNLDQYWEELFIKNLQERFEGVKLNPPSEVSWGGREISIIDLGGVCWHIRQGE
ncbi:MAG: bleomycin resistance protein [Pseudomonadota bacterium]